MEFIPMSIFLYIFLGRLMEDGKCVAKDANRVSVRLRIRVSVSLRFRSNVRLRLSVRV